MAQHILLIAISSAEQRRRFKAALERSRHHLVFALDGEDGLERFGEVKPDLVLAHEHTDRLDGQVLCRLIREAPGGEDVPLVVFGASPRETVGHVDAWLPYPFERRGLLEIIAPLLAYGRPEPEVPADVGMALPVENGERPPVDAQTVVSFQNPFFGGGEGEAQPEDALTREAPTPVGARPPELDFPPTEPEPAVMPEHETEVLPRSVESLVLALDEVSPEPDPADAPRPPTPTEAATLAAVPVHVPEPEPVPQVVPASERPAARRTLDESHLGKRLIQRIRTLYGALDEVDYYQLLGIDAGADDSRIHSAWFDLSLELHPDRFFLLRSGELKEMIYAVYRRASEAHEVLGDPERRAEYDRARKMSSGATRLPESSGPRGGGHGGLELTADGSEGRAFAERAELAFSRGALQDARFHLHALLACEQGNHSALRALSVVEAQVGPSV